MGQAHCGELRVLKEVQDLDTFTKCICEHSWEGGRYEQRSREHSRDTTLGVRCPGNSHSVESTIKSLHTGTWSVGEPPEVADIRPVKVQRKQEERHQREDKRTKAALGPQESLQSGGRPRTS